MLLPTTQECDYAPLPMEQDKAHPRVRRFQQACQEAGLDPLTVVTAAGVHRSAWFRWNNGSFSPSLKNLERIEDALERLTGERDAA
jgi:hypothetical protein